MLNIMEDYKMTPTNEVLIENAILAFLHHYPNHHWALDYADLLEKVRNEQFTTSTVRKRGRKATRQRKKETTSDAPSKEAVQTT